MSEENKKDTLFAISLIVKEGALSIKKHPLFYYSPLKLGFLFSAKALTPSL